MKLKKKDFIEIEFTGRVKDTNEIFDSNIKKDLEKAKLNVEPKPFVFALGEGMFLKGIEDFLMGREIKEKENFEIELSPEKAFGNRDSKLIQRMPFRIFREHNLNPSPGIMFNFDGRIGKVLSVSGGRVLVDFNNPISGKTVIYNVKFIRKVSDINEKAKAFIDFLFKRDFDFKITDKKITINADKQFVKFIEIFKDKFKDALGLELEVKEKPKSGSEKPEENEGIEDEKKENLP